MTRKTKRGENLKTLVSQNIKYFRESSGFSQQELAERAGISIPYLGAIERAEKWPSPSTFAGIAKGLGVEPCDLMKPENATTHEVRKTAEKLIKDITVLVNQSLKQMNTISLEASKTDK